MTPLAEWATTVAEGAFVDKLRNVFEFFPGDGGDVVWDHRVLVVVCLLTDTL